MPEIACINGEFCPLAEARVPIEDRGYQFADGVYEVIVTRDGEPFLMDAHLDRMARSLRLINLPLDPRALGIPQWINAGIERCAFAEVMVYVQVTRGVAARNHNFPDGIAPNVILTFKPKPVYPVKLREGGVELKTLADIRWARCSIKSIALLPNILLKEQARQAGGFDALIVDPAGIVRETSCANVFIVTEQCVRTPPKSDRILHGITREHVLDCCARLGLMAREEDFTIDDLRAADEAFITSSTMDVMPVTRVDDRAVGTGQVGEITQRLAACFDAEFPLVESRRN
jgi:D-alanine transaminase